MPSTIAYKFGDLVLVPFPFTDQTGIKKRPAIVVSSEAYQHQRPDVVLMAVTSRILQPAGNLGEVLIIEWQKAGLPKASLIKPVFTTIEKKLILRKLGELQESDRAALRQTLSTGRWYVGEVCEIEVGNGHSERLCSPPNVSCDGPLGHRCREPNGNWQGLWGRVFWRAGPSGAGVHGPAGRWRARVSGQTGAESWSAVRSPAPAAESRYAALGTTKGSRPSGSRNATSKAGPVGSRDCSRGGRRASRWAGRMPK